LFVNVKRTAMVVVRDVMSAPTGCKDWLFYGSSSGKKKTEGFNKNPAAYGNWMDMFVNIEWVFCKINSGIAWCKQQRTRLSKKFARPVIKKCGQLRNCNPKAYFIHRGYLTKHTLTHWVDSKNTSFFELVGLRNRRLN